MIYQLLIVTDNDQLIELDKKYSSLKEVADAITSENMALALKSIDIDKVIFVFNNILNLFIKRQNEETKIETWWHVSWKKGVELKLDLENLNSNLQNIVISFLPNSNLTLTDDAADLHSSLPTLIDEHGKVLLRMPADNISLQNVVINYHVTKFFPKPDCSGQVVVCKNVHRPTDAAGNRHYKGEFYCYFENNGEGKKEFNKNISAHTSSYDETIIDYQHPIIAIYQISATGNLELITSIDNLPKSSHEFLTDFTSNHNDESQFFVFRNLNNKIGHSYKIWEYQSWIKGVRQAVNNDAEIYIKRGISWVEGIQLEKLLTAAKSAEDKLLIPDNFLKILNANTTILSITLKILDSYEISKINKNKSCWIITNFNKQFEGYGWTNSETRTLRELPSKSGAAAPAGEGHNRNSSSSSPVGNTPQGSISVTLEKNSDFSLTHVKQDRSKINYVLSNFKEKPINFMQPGIKNRVSQFFAKEISSIIRHKTKEHIDVNGTWMLQSPDKRITRYFNYDLFKDEVKEKNENDPSESLLHPDAAIKMEQQLDILCKNDKFYKSSAYYAIVGSAKTFEIALKNNSFEKTFELTNIANAIVRAISATNECLLAAESNDYQTFVDKYKQAQESIDKLLELEDVNNSQSLVVGIPTIIGTGLLGFLAGIALYATIYATFGAVFGLGLGAVPGLFLGIVHGVLQGALTYFLVGGATSIAAASAAGVTMYATPSKFGYMKEAVCEELTDILEEIKVPKIAPTA